jgi:hypothetical protein
MESNESGRMVDGVIEQAIRELEQQNVNAIASAERIYGDAVGNIRTLSAVAGRDVFKDAMCVAVGELYPSDVQAGWQVHTNVGQASARMTVVRSRLTRDTVPALVSRHHELTNKGRPGPLRAVLVIFEDDYEDDVAKARAKV